MSAPVYTFDRFRLDPARRELWRDAERLELPPKVFDCIAYLLVQRERAVGRDELIAAVWGRTDVSDNLLDQSILRARRALGDTEGERRYIRTMPRFGFRWIAPVHVADEHETVEPATSSVPRAPAVPTTPAQAPSPPRWRLAWLAFALVLVVVGIAWAWMRLRSEAPAPVPMAALVLPFEVHAQGPSGWVRLGAMDLVAEQLRAGGRRVLPSDNVVALTRAGGPWTRGGARTLELARTSGASIIVAGEAELAEGRWRVRLRTLAGTDEPVVVEARASEVLDAARSAAASLEDALGWQRARDDLPPGSELALRLRQVDAALLADQAEVARQLLDELGAAERELPEVRYRRAGLDLREGDLDGAQAGFEALLGQVSATDAPLLRARVLNALGNVQLRRDHPDRVAAFSDQAIALLEELPPSPELGRALTGRAIARSLQSRYDESMEDFARARVVLESAGDRLALARVDINVGILDARRARHAEALPVLAAAADRLTAYRDFNNELFARLSLARVRLELLDGRAALVGDERVRELVQVEPSPAKRRYANLVRAMVLQATGHLAESDALLASVRADATAAGDAPVAAMGAALAARATIEAGDAARALDAAHASLATDWSGEGESDYARAWRQLQVAQRAAGRDATPTLEAMRAWASARDDEGVRIQLDLAQAAAASDGQARASFERAFERADARRVPAELVEVAQAYLPWLLEAGELARAGVIAGRVGGWAEHDHAAALLQLRYQHALGHADGWRSALVRARSTAGERQIPAALERPPAGRG